MKMRRTTNRGAVIDFICICSILFFTWPIVRAIIDSSSKMTMTWDVVLSFIFTCFIFYAYPILVICINHIDRINSKRLIINILSAAILAWVLWKSIFMAIDNSYDIFLSTPLFIAFFSIAPILIFIFNNND